MQITFCGIRGSIPTNLSSEEVVNRILPHATDGQISVKKLKSLAKKGLLGYGGDTPCVLLKSGDDHIIIDAGSGIRRINKMELGDHLNILLTHLHWDHIQGLPFVKHCYLPNNKVRIYSALDAKLVEESLKKQWSAPFFPVPYEAIAPQFEYHQIKLKDKVTAFKVESLLLDHPFTTYGYKVNDGKSIYAHMSDTELTILRASEKKKYKKFLSNANFIAADSQFDSQEAEMNKTWGHSCIEHFIDICAGGSQKSLGLFHYNPVESDEKIDEIFKKAKAYKRKVDGGETIKLITCVEGQTHQI